MDRLGIETLTVFGMPPLEHAKLAADLGCSHISTGLTAVPWKLERFPDWSLRDNPGLRREMIAIMRDRDVSISLAEGFIVRPQVEATDYRVDLDLMAELGAERASTISIEPDMGRSLDQLAKLAEMTAERGMGFMLEFALPHTINSLEKALAAIRHVGMPNIKLLIDAMHFFRSGGSIAELSAIDHQLIGYAQLCDAPLAGSGDYYGEACFERKCPGDGEMPLRELMEILPHDIPIGLEVPMMSAIEAGEDLEASVRCIVEASRRLLDLSS